MKWIFRVVLILLIGGVSAQTKPFVLGSIAEIESRELSEKRVLNIYLPEGYNADQAQQYPVIYLLDGSADEDFIHISGLVQYCNFEWVKLLPKSIVVGIANVDRRRDFTFPTTIEKDRRDFPTTGGSEKFIRFIENELQPFIRANYRTNGTNMLIGQSLGGLLASEILIKKPALFSSYVIVSPSFWWDNESLLRSASDKMTLPSNTSVYVAVGNEGKIMVNDARHLVKLLKQTDANVAFHYFKKENHATIFHLAVYDAFENFQKVVAKK